MMAQEALLQDKILKKSIVLVGLMGCGKSAVGKRFAKYIKTDFIDLDKEIEKKEGKTITRIFQENGEEYFRDCERSVLKDLLHGDPCVIATGGGAFINEQSRRLIKDKSISIWIDADFDVLLERVSRKKTRPLLEKGNKEEILRDLMQKRYPIYEEAKIRVKSTTAPHERVIEEIMNKLRESGE
ncbi:shikimate kinase [Rickettsiales bacterium]|nr:shikimate kinase [Rickettsiales bacterium]